MVDNSHQTLFLDTNCLLHYPPIDQIDWGRLTGTPTVKLCICMTVVHELDDKKSDPLLGDRAGRVLKELSQFGTAGGIISEGVTLAILPGEHRQADFPPALSPDSPDDAILLHLLKYRDAHPDESVALVSEEFGMEVKCSTHAIAMLKPSLVAKRLPNPADARTKEHRMALAKLERLENRLPALRVLVGMSADASPKSRVVIELAGRPALRDVESDIQALVGKYPKRTGGRTRLDITGAITYEEYVRYNSEVDEYVPACRTYLVELSDYEDKKSRSFQAVFWLQNEGGAPAEDIDVHLRFPDGFTIYAFEDRLKPPAEPKPPVPPRTRDEIRKDLWRRASVPPLDLSSIITNSLGAVQKPSNVSAPEIRKTKSYDVDIAVKHLKHGYPCELGTFEFVFDSWDAVKSFNVNYRCTAGNHPLAMEGKLHFIIGGTEP